jgi:hypothetical protein
MIRPHSDRVGIVPGGVGAQDATVTVLLYKLTAPAWVRPLP